MASDVEDPTMFYADLPSIFEKNSSACIESSNNTIITDVNTEKSYQPMFASFLFAESDPFSKAAFVSSSSLSIEIETTQEQLMEDSSSSDDNDISSSIQTTPLSPLLLAPIEDMDEDEDDFDGIPIRHAPEIIKKKLNGDSDLIHSHSKDDRLFDELIHHIENSHDDNDIEDESFLNGFTDEQHDTTTTVPSLFKNIPDIDDSNEHDEEDDDDDRIPFDHMDMFDHSDSIRSSSPDSLLSSSHLQDEQDDDIDIDNEVAQWNDDLILDTTSTNINSHPSLNLHIHPFEQVDFIDTSRSNSRCSNTSSHLSIGYADQAHAFLSDDGFLTSSDSDNNDNDDNIINFDCDTFNPNENEDICLQVNLDDHRSLSPFSKSNSTHSLSPNQDETSIIDIDEDNNESKILQIAPMAALDDDDDDDDGDLPTFISAQSVLSYIKTFLELKNEKRQNDIVHDIINMKHLLNENDHDDEFIAIMHNPNIFEQTLYNDHQKKSDLVKQTNSVTSTFRPSIQLSIGNKIKKDSFEHHQNIHQISSLLETNNEKTPSNSSFFTRKTTNKSSFPDVNHLVNEEKENDVLMNINNTTDAILNKIQKKEQLFCPQINTSDIDITNNKKHHQVMNIDSESDDDLELLKTLSQLHDIINPTPSFEEINEVKLQLSSYSPDINQKKCSSDFLFEKKLTNGNETELLNEKKQVRSLIIPSSPHVIDTIKQSDEEKEEKNEKKNVVIYKNHNDVDGDDKQKEKYERREEEKKPTTFFSLTSSTSPILFNDDSHSPVVFIDPDASYSLPNLLLLPLNARKSSSNQSITDDLQISNTKSNMSNLSNDEVTQRATSNLFDPFAPITTTTTTTMFDDALVDSKTNDEKTQPLANYNFDDLWNQSMSHVEPSNDDVNPDTFTWEAFLNTNENTNLLDYNKTIPNSNITLDSSVNKEEKGKNDSESTTTFIATQNLETILKDIEMNGTPFDPIPSPPLHIDHTVTNPLINATHHELFPIDELEQPNISQGQQSMILYEDEEGETEAENNKISSFDDDVKPIVEKLASNILKLALKQVNISYEQIEHFVDQILSQAIFDVYNENNNIPINETILTENLASIISWHDQTKAIDKQIPDPFDQKFDSVWSKHFQTPDDTIFINENKVDPWLITTESKKDIDPMLFFSETLDESDLFSSSNKISEKENDETTTFSEYLPPPLLTDTSNTTTAANNLMKYTLTAPVIDDSGDDSSTLEDYFISRKNESLVTTNIKVDEQSSEINEQENLFTNKIDLSQFDAFASDQPLYSPKITSITAPFDEEINESLQTDENTPWTSVDKPNSAIGDDEPWELEDHGEEKMTPIPTTTRLASAFNDNEHSLTEKKNFFSDSFDQYEDAEETVTKTVRFDDNVESIRAATPQEDTPSDSDEITPTFEPVNDRIEASFVNIDETDLTTERPYESIELTPKPVEDLPSSLNDTSNISNDNIPLETTLSPSNTKTNLRSESQIITTDTNIRSNTNTQLVQPYESVLLRSTSKDDSSVDPDEINGVIPCVIDNTQVNIDAKSINPFKCVIASAGTLKQDNQTAVIVIYGCALPDHRLREYRYIMDQLFYYVYHKLEKLVTNDYILIYFHGATPKHRTPDLKFLRKYYQMINFRLRKNLRSVYVVHPTLFLRTVITLARPFFSKKFFRKVHYIYTIAELERQFPNNRLSIPVAIEQTDWLYSQKYDRDNASINRSIIQPISRSMANYEDESAA